jgi:hypothetical protein
MTGRDVFFDPRRAFWFNHFHKYFDNSGEW